MKRFLLLSAVMVLFTATGYAGAPPPVEKDKAPEWLKPGVVLVYGVDFHGKTYDFIVTVKKLAPDLVFDYEMTAPASKKGNITIKEKALDKSTKQSNMFMGGPVVLEDETTVWVSREVIRQYRGDVLNIRIDTGSGLEIFLPAKPNDPTYKTELDGKDVEYPIWHLTHHGKQTLWIFDNLAAPLIFKMDLGWKIWLKEIKTKK